MHADAQEIEQDAKHRERRYGEENTDQSPQGTARDHARNTTTEGTRIVWPWIRGVRRFPSFCWIARKAAAVSTTVPDEIENATSTAGTAPSQAPRKGITAVIDTQAPSASA